MGNGKVLTHTFLNVDLLVLVVQILCHTGGREMACVLFVVSVSLQGETTLELTCQHTTIRSFPVSFAEKHLRITTKEDAMLLRCMSNERITCVILAENVLLAWKNYVLTRLFTDQKNTSHFSATSVAKDLHDKNK
jgi:hypothetical protein